LEEDISLFQGVTVAGTIISNVAEMWTRYLLNTSLDSHCYTNRHGSKHIKM